MTESTPILSIIIVSYNAKQYLHLTLSSLSKLKDIDNIEVIIVDNNSLEDTIGYCKSDFPNFKFVENKCNQGFSKANNIGIEHSTSDIFLFLNPDVIISDIVIETGIKNLNQTQIGAVAIKMIDGFGEYLPESKRGFPDIANSFLKFIYLDRILPKTLKSNKYYNAKEGENTIEVLSGACFFIKKSVYQSIGGLDERYFMYGEDIDLSYQLHINNLKINYVEDCEIVHFKGRSTKKNQWTYLNAFYNAMKLYWNKNLNNPSSIVLSFIISFSVEFFKIFAWITHSLKSIFFPILDFTFIYIAIVSISKIWSIYFKHDIDFLSNKFYLFILPIYILGWILSYLINNMYNFIFDIRKYINSIVFGIVFSLFLYFILPSDFKFSRIIVIFIIAISIVIPFCIRLLANALFNYNFIYKNKTTLEARVIPTSTKLEEINNTISNNSNWTIGAATNDNDKILDVNLLSNEEIIEYIKTQNPKQNIWLYSKVGSYLLQSLGKNHRSFIVSEDTNFNIAELSFRFQKRLFDIVFSCLFLTLSIPISFIFRKPFIGILKNAFQVFIGHKTYISIENLKKRKLFFLKKGVFIIANQDMARQRNYLKNYTVSQDFFLLLNEMFKKQPY